MLFFRPSILAMLALSALSSASAADYYVTPSGNDRNSGSSSSPWATIAHAADVVRSGDTVHVAPGNYSGSINVTNSGTQSARITFISDTPWAAHVQGQGTVVWAMRGDAITVQGFDVTGDGSSYYGIVNYGSYGLIKGNHIHNIAAPVCNGGGGAGIMNGSNYTAHDNDIINNVVHDIGNLEQSCHQIHGIYHANIRGKIQNNIVYRAVGFGIHTWHAAQNVTIANNLSFSNGASGIIVGAGDSPGGVTADNFVVTNNICLDNHDWGIVESGQVGTHNTYANNLLYGNRAGTAQTRAAATNTISRDPALVDYDPNGNGDYHLTASSPAVATGTWQGAPSFDLDNETRPQGSSMDIGPYAMTRDSQQVSTTGSLRDGTYSLISQSSGMMLDNPAFSVKAGTQLIQWNANGGSNQNWRISLEDNGRYTIQNEYSGLYLTDSNGKLTEQPLNSTTNQLWTLNPAGSGRYVIANVSTGRVLDVPGYSNAAGTGVITYAPNGGSNQIWRVQ